MRFCVFSAIIDTICGCSVAWRKLLGSLFSRPYTGICAVVLLLFCDVAHAQPFFFGNNNPRESSAAMVGYSIVDFKFDGDDSPLQPLTFDAPVYTLTYSRTNVYAAFSFGSQNAPDTTTSDLSFIDFSGALWGDVFFSEEATEADHRIFLPITFYTNYRKVAPKGVDVLEEFNITTLGLGLGFGYYGKFNDDVMLEIRSVPVIGLAVRSLGDSAGTSRLLDNDIQLHLGSLFNSIGVSLGYHFRVMIWDVKTSSVFGNLSEDLFNYREQNQTFSIGLNW